MINSFAFIKMHEHASVVTRQIFIYFFIAICIVTVLSLAVVMLVIKLTYSTRTFLLKNNLFTSLFLKRQFLFNM